MNFKLKNRTLLNADIIRPENPYAEFSNEIASKIPKRIVNSLNHGHTMLMIYKQYRDNLHFTNVSEMLKKMEDTFRDYDCIDFEIMRGK